MKVLDASVVVDFLLDVPPVGGVVRDYLDAGEELHAPHLIDAEVGQVMRRYVLAGWLERPRARQVLDVLADMPLRRHGHILLLARALGLMDNLTFYDGLYVALAEALETDLVTKDGGIARAPGVGAPVVLLGSS